MRSLDEVIDDFEKACDLERRCENSSGCLSQENGCPYDGAESVPDVLHYLKELRYILDNMVWVKPEEKGHWEIKTLITDSGCLIKKADPRIDTEHRLTLEDLRGMIGEPVWMSSVNAWLLVVSCDDQYATLRWPSGNMSTGDENDLSSYPLYRIKKDVAGSKGRGEDDDTGG